MTNLEHAIKHIKTRADAWAVKEVTEALQSISEKLDKALSQEPIKYWIDHNGHVIPIQQPCDTENCKIVKALIGDPCKVKEPCDDAISREKTCDYIAEFVNNEYSTQSECDMVDLMIKGIKHLPSVTQKSGKWISVSERLPEEYGEYLITWKNPKYPKTYIGICECEITDVYDHEHNRFEVEWLFDGYIATAYPDSKVIAWMPLPEPYKAESEE